MPSANLADWTVSTVAPPSQLLEYIRVIRGNLAWISLLAVIGVLVGWLYSTLSSSMYQARTVLNIRSLNENFLNSAPGSSTSTTDSVLPEAYVQTEIKILQSDSIRKKAMDKLLEKASGPAQPASEKPETPSWLSPWGWFKPTRVPFGDLVADAGRRVKLRAIGNTRIVDVLCDAQDGQLAANMCNTLGRSYIENNMESRVQSTKETSEWLQSQLDDVRRRLTKAESDLKDAGKTTDFGPTTEVAESPAQERLRQLQTELSRSQTERIAREAYYRVAATRQADSLPVEMDAGPIREYRLRLTELRRQFSEMKATITPEHYKYRELKMQIEEVERALQSERDGAVSRLRAELDAAEEREKMISSAYDKQAQQVSKRDDLAVRYNMVKHEVDSERRLYETLLQRVGEVGLTAAMRTSTISIVDQAVAPLKPYSPNTLASISLGFFGGSAVGLAFSLIRARSDRTLRSPGEASMHLQLRELGVIPSVRQRGFLLRLKNPPSPTTVDLNPATGKAVSSLTRKAEAFLMPRVSARSIALATWLRVPEITEAFFGTMNSLIFAANDVQWSARVIVITSPEVGDGKTTVATNLAIAMAQIGRRVVLVDGDLRKPRLHTIFDTSAENGLSKILEENDSISERPLHQLVSETQIPNLYVIPTKPAHGGISSKLHSARMRELLKRLRLEFDSVIIDSPPMQHISDARVLGWLADGVLLVFRARKTTREAALSVSDCLVQDGIHVLGTVLNDWNPRKGERYGAYSSYFRIAS